MSISQIVAPLPVFNDLDGSPLDSGFIYIGLYSQNPETSPISVYWDAAATQPAAQPLRTINGYISRAGSPANVYTTADDFSITVRSKNRGLVYYLPSVLSITGLRDELADDEGSALIGFKQSGLGAVVRTSLSKMRDVISARDFGAIGDNTLHTVAEWIIPGALGRFANLAALQVEYPHVTATTDSIDWAAIQAAIASTETTDAQTTGAIVSIGAGRYIINKTITSGASGKLGRVNVRGVGTSTRLVLASGSNVDLFAPKNGQFLIQDIFFDGNKSGNTSGSCVVLDNTSEFPTFQNCEFRLAADYGCETTGGNQQLFLNCRFMGNRRGFYSTNNNVLDFVCCTFEDNYDRGLEIAGSSTGQLVNLIGCYLENNADFGSGAVAAGYHIEYTGMQADHKLNVNGCYFNGQQSAAFQWAIRLDEGASIDGVRVGGCKFVSNSLGSFDISSTTSAVGLNDLRGNTYEATPLPARRLGFLRDDSFDTVLMTTNLDLSAGTITKPVGYDRNRPIRINKLYEIYTEASSADAGITVNFGIEGASGTFYSGTSATSQAVFSKIDRTSAMSVTRTVGLDKMLVINQTGTKVGAGEIVFHIDYTVF